MSEIGLMINKMVLENNPGQMAQFIKDNIKMGKNMEKDYSCGVMIQITMAISVKIISMEKVNIVGKMEEFIKDNG